MTMTIEYPMFSISRIVLSILVFGILFFHGTKPLSADPTKGVSQSARDVQVAYDVDLLVVGGSTGGVVAATEAANAGAKVLLVTPYPYLGEDRTATLRLWPEAGEDTNDPLAQQLMADPHRSPSQTNRLLELALLSAAEGRIPYTYKILEPIDPLHAEINAPGRLADRHFSNPVDSSLQVNGNATIIVDLGESQSFSQAMLLGFQRETGYKPFKLEKVLLSLSDDGKNWKSTGEPLPIENRYDGIGQDSDTILPFTFRSEVPQKSRYLKFKVQKTADSDRVMLAELMIFSKPIDLEKTNKRTDENLIQCPRPMHIKHTLDQTLLDAGVPFLFNTFVDRDVNVKDATGNVRGVVISNRAGRQAVIAKKILYADSKPTSLAKAQFVVIGGQPVEPNLSDFPLLKSISSETIGEPFISLTRQIPGQWGSEAVYDLYPVINYTFDVAVPEGTKIDDLAFRRELENQIRLATFDPKQAFTADEIYFGQPLKPLSFWRNQGKALAKEALAVKAPQPEILKVVSQLKTAEQILPGDVCEILSGVRAGLDQINESAPRISDPARVIPVLAEYDVVVVGGGTSGAPAGIAAGRHGAKTLVLEHLHDLGGIGTAGAISIYWYGNRVEGVLVTTPFGTGIVKAKFVIDATGNADVAAAAGAETAFVNAKEIAVQGAGLAPRNLGASYTNTDYMFVDETDVIDSTHVFVYAKEKFDTAFDLGKLLSTRERRQIVGDFSFNVLDQVNHRTYPDSIVYAYSDYDTHGYTVDPYMELNHPYGNHHDPGDRT